MKIICVGRNYVKHIEELKNEIPSEPVIFLKPDTALLKDNAPFYYPSFSKDIQYETELVVKIEKEGKFIPKKFAHKYYTEIGLGIDFTARDKQNELKKKGLPWELAKAFNHSAVVSHFLNKNELELEKGLNFSLTVNNETRQIGNSSLMIYSIDELISFVSTYFTLKKGDLIFTGTPEGVGPINIGDQLQGFIENKKMFDFSIK
jgi:2-keto-4-pentenoate hydratase/2-oxohepta-3-ene-1,7-dioic acid hydratase in catechol pathway